MQPSPLFSDYVLKDRVVMTLQQLPKLQQLVLCRSWYKTFSFVDLTASSVKKLHSRLVRRRIIQGNEEYIVNIVTDT